MMMLFAALQAAFARASRASTTLSPKSNETSPQATTAALAQTKAPIQTQTDDDPPHRLVRVNRRDRHKVSDAIVEALNAAIDEIKALTGIDIGVGFGDTSRALGRATKKVGADNFSWHKTGRAIDFNQGLKWVISEDPRGHHMYFRLYLKAKEQSTDRPYAHRISREDKKKLHYNGLGRAVTKTTLIDVTAILVKQGFERIKAHKGWRNSYNKREWWHYAKSEGLCWYEALREIYSEAVIVRELKKLPASRRRTAGRLAREGFPDEDLKAIWNQKPVTIGKLRLFFSVGDSGNCANIVEDVAAVRGALQGLGIQDDPKIETMIRAYQRQQRSQKPDGQVWVGGKLHTKIGRRMT